MARAAIAEVLRRPGVQITFGLHAALAIVLCFVPLFDVLGFERAFATGLLSAVTSPIIAVSMVRRARDAGGGDLARVTSHAFLLNLLSLVPALLCGVGVELASQPCDTEEGVIFLILCAGGNASFCTAVGIFAGALAYRRPIPGIVITIALLGFVLVAFLRLYSEPQIFVYNLPFGYWPGSIYDEELSVSTSLWAFRGYTLLWALSIVGIARAQVDREQLLLTAARPRWTATAGVACLVAGTIAAQGWGERLGFDLDRTSVLEQLNRRVETEHFEIFIDPLVSREELERISSDHELRYQQLSRFFGYRPTGRIRSLVYRDATQKAALMGAGRTQVARPWAREIHINGFEYPHPVLKHELAHVFAAEIGEGAFKVPASGVVFVNIGVVEGTAVAADWPVRGGLTIHGWTRAMKLLDLMPDLRQTLDVTGFWTISSARAYTVAGSFIRYLVDQFGMEKLATLYATNSFHKAYGRSLDSLVTEWEAFVDALPLPKSDLLIAEHRFKQPGIFQKVCAHKAANLARRGHLRLGSGDLAGGKTDLERVFEYSPGNPAPLVAISHALAREGELEAARSYAQRALQTTDATQKSTALATESIANIDWRRLDIESARRAYEEVLGLHLSIETDRLQLARLAALERPPEAQDVLRQYLLGDLSTPLALVRLGALSTRHPDDSLIRYLYGRNLEVVGANREGVVELRAAIELGLPGEPLMREAHLTLGRLLLADGKASDAREQFERIAAQARVPAFRLQATDWAERAGFVATSTGSSP